jgi:hypothetical protein
MSRESPAFAGLSRVRPVRAPRNPARIGPSVVHPWSPVTTLRTPNIGGRRPLSRRTHHRPSSSCIRRPRGVGRELASCLLRAERHQVADTVTPEPSLLHIAVNSSTSRSHSAQLIFSGCSDAPEELEHRREALETFRRRSHWAVRGGDSSLTLNPLKGGRAPRRSQRELFQQPILPSSSP